MACIGIDEFAVKKGHAYKNIVVDLWAGRIVYVGARRVQYNHREERQQTESFEGSR